MADAMTTHGAVSWSELHTPENSRSHVFYSRLFGWQTKRYELAEVPYTELQLGDRGFGGVVPAGSGRAAWLNYITVDDVDEVCQLARDNGGSVISGPYNSPAGRVAKLADPGGAEFFVIKYRPVG